MSDNGNTNGNGFAPPTSATGQTKPKPSRIHQRNQAATLQRLTYDAALSLRTACTKAGVFTVTRDEATALAQLVRAWDTARDAVRILRGKGLPASVRSKSARSPASVEPLEPA
jgi:hypothetical protein